MRRAWILSLIIGGLGTSFLWAQGPPAPVRQHGKPIKIFKVNGPPPSDNVPEKGFNVSSLWNLKKDEALVNALENARDQVDSYLREQKQRLEWTPSIAFVRNRMLADLSTDEVAKIIGEDHKGKLEPFLIDGRFRAVEETREVNQPEGETKRVWLRVVVNPETWKQMQKENQRVADQRRLDVTKGRMVFLVKLLAGIVVLLLTICGYIRLDEWSKGYYTKWLRLGAFGCVGAVSWVLLWTLVHR
jgi:hypothetical protein